MSYNPKAIGENSEGQILAALLKMNCIVLMPFGDNQRYDFVIEKSGEFVRVQCKTGRIKDGVVFFDACSSSYHRGGKKNSYKGEADIFAVYCPSNDQSYVIPVMEVGETSVKLRIEPPKNGQKKGVRWAKDYLLQDKIN